MDFRTLAQAEALEELLQELGQDYDYVLNLEVPDEVVVARLLARGKEQGRSDDADRSDSQASGGLSAADGSPN